MDIKHILFIHLVLIPFSIFHFVRSDPDPLQDYCIADTKNQNSTFFNGVPCINPNYTLATHFATNVLSQPGEINQTNFNITFTNVNNFPGINTLGLIVARIDIAANGLVPPHSHPRASELVILLEGSLLVGFVDTSSRLYRQQLSKGDCFIFPKGLVHFLYNTDSNKSALAISGLNSQNPGAQMSSFSTLATNPPMPREVLKGIKVNDQDVVRIRKNLGG